jgi:hypothetical protein
MHLFATYRIPTGHDALWLDIATTTSPKTADPRAAGTQILPGRIVAARSISGVQERVRPDEHTIECPSGHGGFND